MKCQLKEDIMRIIKTKLAFFIVIAVILSLAGCGRSNESSETNSSTQTVGDGPRPGDTVDIQPDDSEIIGATQLPPTDDPYRFYGQTLTISSTFFADTLERLAQSFMALHPDVTVEVVEGDIEETGLALMAGDAPILMCHWLVDVYDTRISGLFADWFPIMYAEPGFNEDDYFVNFFNANIVNGRLYTFPISITFDFVTVNSTIPGLAQAMEWYRAQYNGITTSQLMGMHRSFAALSPSPLYHDRNFDVTTGVRNNIHDFFDWESRLVDFYNQYFIDFITYAKALTHLERNSGVSIPTTPSEEAAMSELYMFYYIPPLLLQYHIDFEDSLLYSTATPIVNNQGELVVRTWEAYVLNAAATPVQQALALEFMQFAASRAGRAIAATHYFHGRTSIMHSPFALPVNRDALGLLVTGNMSDVIRMTSHYNLEIVGTRDDATENALEHLTAIGEMPMAPVQPNHIHDIIGNVLNNFYYGFINADEVASYLQEHITAALPVID